MPGTIRSIEQFAWDTKFAPYMYPALYDTFINSSGGSVWYADSVIGSATGGGSPDSPCKTINQAIDKARAVTGRHIVIDVPPWHTETISDATSLVMDKNDITVKGRGWGDNRPTITFDNAAGTITMSGTGTRLENVILTVSGVTDVTAGITVSGAGVIIRDVEFRGVDADTDFSSCILTTNAAERLTVENCDFNVSDTLPTHGVNVVGAVDRLTVRNCRFYGTFSTGCVDLTTVACTNALVEKCVFHNKSAAVTKDVVDTITGSTFQVIDCWDGVAGYEIAGGSTRPVAYSGGGPILLEWQDTALAAAADDMFNFIGGISIDRIDGYVTTVIESAGTTVQLHCKASQAAAAVAMSTNGLDINAFVVNSNIHWNRDASDALAGTTDVSVYEGAATAVQHPWTAYGTAITSAITVTYGNASSGAIKWFLAYTPLTPGAYAKPAAA
jgi:hypothetical protein